MVASGPEPRNGKQSPETDDRHRRPATNYGATTSTPSTGSQSPRARTSPERLKRNSSTLLVAVPEDSIQMEFDTPSPRYTGGAALNGDDDEHVELDERVEEWLIDEELSREGLYRGSYKRFLTLYSLTPLSTLLTFAFLTCLPLLAYPLDSDSPHTPYPYSPYFPYPFPELLAGAALWAFSLLLRDLLSTLSAQLQDHRGSFLVTIASTILQSVLSVLLQLATTILLLISPSDDNDRPTWHDHAFRRVWAVALGWAGIEAIVGIKQGYESLALYRDVLVTVKRIPSPDILPTQNLTSREDISLIQRGDEDNERQPLLSPVSPNLSRKAIERELENDLEQLMALKGRAELEVVYGLPFIYIPVFIPCLHRINAVLLSLGSFLLLSGSYLRSPYAASSPPSHHIHHLHPTLHIELSNNSSTLFIITLLGVTLCQLTLAVLHSAWILPRIGVHTFVYVNLLISLGIFFAGLGYWEALV
ncbi:hypothetical protein CC1G_09447 [Coprinopsis cinerea okayama7|uniref:Uncharacterized protein n=1 Tax=Coprinopsis cinerea (strain Okayama-7 / 130 / ATCC MYA-4618 / FGSC 9003) TaxID=240176 RepID=A8NIM7_COPC7|nr:hypothetical protein CC1G_09447 [Coprinopsis cinerea okayama7\|eukprot:XP_001834033.2 hypothetical protein CC1G_09447 [Coprinopsis cinerea okayama7\